MKNFVEAKFEQFVEDFHLEANRNANWIRFINYQFFSQFQPGRLDTDLELLDEICVESSEFPEIQGALFLLNDQIISEPQDIDEILQRDQKGLLVMYFLTLGDVEHFQKQLERLFQNLDSINKKESWIRILAYAMSQKVILRWTDNPILNAVIYDHNNVNLKKICDSYESYFSKIEPVRIDEKSLKEMINSNENTYTAKIECNAPMMIPGEREGISNAYVVCLSAHEVINLITTSDGLLRRNLFDDNVRDSQGFSTVNQEIYSTLKEEPGRFVLFNNGITIVCRKITPDKGRFVLENPQIVNGCQTCNMIYEAYQKNMDIQDVQVIAKIVGADEEGVTQGIVRAANRQNIVYEEAFETIRGFHKDLEKYFEINQVRGYRKIYYERRARQYQNNVQIKPQQKISFRGLIQSMVALFLNHVEESHRHEYTLLREYKNSLFIDVHSCQPYYVAAFLYLNVDELFRRGVLPQKLYGYKMHVMLLIKEINGGPSPDLSSKDIDKYCERLLGYLEGGQLQQCAMNACDRFENISGKWIEIKGEQYRHGIKDSAEFRNFLMKELYGTTDERDAEKLYTGYVMKVSLDKHSTLYGFIEHSPDNIFFHEFDNPDMDRSYIGKKVSYKIIRNGDQERAINVRLIKS